jgi:hypothetical protein
MSEERQKQIREQYTSVPLGDAQPVDIALWYAELCELWSHGALMADRCAELEAEIAVLKKVFSSYCPVCAGGRLYFDEDTALRCYDCGSYHEALDIAGAEEGAR